MAIMYYVQGTPVSEEEANQKSYSGELDQFNKNVELGRSAKLKFENGEIDSEDFRTPNFTPIGIGKPLSIQIENIYTGDAPERFLGKKDLLVVSGVKSNFTFESAPKVINQIIPKVEDNKSYELSAFHEGSSIVYYTPALDMDTVICSFHLIADTFNEKTFKTVSSLLSKAGALFAPAQGILLAGSVISEMIGNLGKAIFETSPFFKDTFTIKLNSPGQMITKASHFSLIQDRDKKELQSYTASNVTSNGESFMRLVHRETGKEYKGNAPYILVSLDGRSRPELRNYKNTVATAAILEKFYGTERNAQTATTIQEAMVLYNDFKFYNKARNLKDKMTTMDSSSNEYKNTEALLKAFIENIDNEIFKDNINS